MRSIQAIICLLIVYGSLYPFNLDLSSPSTAQISALFNFSVLGTGKSDLLSNILLFVPLGLAAAFTSRDSRSNSPSAEKPSLLLYSIISFVFAFLVQVAQLFVDGRIPYGADAIFNLIGFVIGFVGLGLFQHRLNPLIAHLSNEKLLSLGLLLLLFIALYKPFVPTLDIGLVVINIKNMLSTDSVGMGLVLEYFGLYLLSLLFIRHLGFSGVLIFLFSALSIILQLFIVDSNFILSKALGLAIALIVFTLIPFTYLKPQLPGRFDRSPVHKDASAVPSNVLILLIGLSYMIANLTPFQLSAYTQSMHLLPFKASLDGSMLVNLSAMLHKLVFFASLLWFCWLAGKSLVKSALVLSALVFSVELSQMFLVSRTSDITDVILVILSAYLLKTVHEQLFSKLPISASNDDALSAKAADESNSNASNLGASDLSASDSSTSHSIALDSMKKSTENAFAEAQNEGVAQEPNSLRHLMVQNTGIIATFFALVLGQMAVMNLPNLPYNVAQLYGGSNNFFNYAFLATGMLIFSLGGVWVAQKVASDHITHYKAPLYLALVSMLTLLCLKLSVTPESIADINGSSNIVYQLTGELILGEPGRDFVYLVGVENAAAFSRVVEPFVRFSALTGPVLYLIMWCTLCLNQIFPKTGKSYSHASSTSYSKNLSAQINSGSTNGNKRDVRRGIKQCATSFIVLLPWFFLCKLITFDYSSTDNLNELIARDGEYGLGGGGYLYLLVFCLIAVSSFLAWSASTRRPVVFILALIVTAGSVPVNWFLLSNGLEQNVSKYGYTFSGVDFLLGPDRSELLPESELQLRWAIVNIGLCLSLSAGLMIGYGRFFASSNRRIKNSRLHASKSRLYSEYQSSTNSSNGAKASNTTIIKNDLEAKNNMAQVADVSNYISERTIDEKKGEATEQETDLAKRKEIHINTNAKGSYFMFKKPVLLVSSIVMVAIIGFVVVGGGNTKIRDYTNPFWANSPASVIMDTHVHTNFSDGALSPSELASLAVVNGCNALAITDHADSSKTFQNERVQAIQKARMEYPELTIFNGIELNPPPYKGREHVNIITLPKNEASMFKETGLLKLRRQSKGAQPEFYFSSIMGENQLSEEYFAIYNHPSRKDSDEKENLQDILKWRNNNQVLMAMSGAPGHQRNTPVGSYRTLFSTIDRWDPAVAAVGSTWDQLLDSGVQFWGALAVSDYHNASMDYAPCAFARVRLSVPEDTHQGILKALRAGTFFSDHGRILQQLKLSAQISQSQAPIAVGQVSEEIEKGLTAKINISIERDVESLALPFKVSLISNCVSGRVEEYEINTIEPLANSTSSIIPLNKAGSDGESCFLRARLSTEINTSLRSIMNGEIEDKVEPLFAYTNHIRFILSD